MDIENLLGPMPSTKNGVFVKHLKPLQYAGEPNIVVAFWMAMHSTAEAWVVMFVCAGIFSCMGIFVYPIVCIPLFFLWLYLEGSSIYWWWFAAPSQPKDIPLPPFAEAAEMLQASGNENERRSILIGKVYGAPWVVLLADKLRRLGLHITGSAGSWKSMGVVMPMLLQLISRADEVVIFFDLGGDAAAMHMLRTAAKKAGVDCYIFTINPEKKSHVFNFLKQTHHRKGEKLGGSVAQALGIVNAQMRPEEKYFASQSEQLAINEFETFKKDTIREVMVEVGKLSTGELSKKIGRPVRDIEHGETIHLALRVLADILGMNGPDSEESIDFMRIIGSGRPAVIYFDVPVSENLSAALSATQLAIQAIMGAAHRFPRNHTPVTVVIDEAQSLVRSSMQPFYQQMRKFGISIWTIHQNFQDLIGERNLLPMVVNNAAVGIHLGVRDPIGRKHIEEIGGNIQVMRETVNAKGEITITPVWEPRIKTEDFDLVNNSQGLAFATINGGREGFSSFNHTFICEVVGFTCSPEEFEEYQLMPWPELTNAVDIWNFSPSVSDQQPITTKESRSAAAALALAALEAH